MAFYFAFTQSYSAFLTFPAVLGVLCWLYYGSYSIGFALVNCLWSVVFVEYWKLKETDLSIRWGVKGVGVLKATRMEFVWDKEVIDPLTGELRKVFSSRKQVLRQMLQIPFGILAGVVLGLLVVATFAMEVLISEVYQGPFKTYLVSFLLLHFSAFSILTLIGLSSNNSILSHPANHQLLPHRHCNPTIKIRKPPHRGLLRTCTDTKDICAKLYHCIFTYYSDRICLRSVRRTTRPLSRPFPRQRGQQSLIFVAHEQQQQ